MLVKTLDSKVKELGIPIYPEPGAAQILLSYIQNRQQAVQRVILKVRYVWNVAASVSAKGGLPREELLYESQTMCIYIGGCHGRPFGD